MAQDEADVFLQPETEQHLLHNEFVGTLKYWQALERLNAAISGVEAGARIVSDAVMRQPHLEAEFAAALMSCARLTQVVVHRIVKTLGDVPAREANDPCPEGSA